MSPRRANMNLILSTVVLLSLIVQPLAAAAVMPDPKVFQKPSGSPGFLFRATVTLDGSRNLARLEELGVVVLSGGAEEQGSRGAEVISSAPLPLRPSAQLIVLADADQLADLARLAFRPRGADELRSLLDAQGPARAWLAQGLSPLLAQADAISAQRALAGIAGAAAVPDAALGALRAAVQALTPEQIAATADSISVDDDADGLTNTEEAWWCTDPLNPNSDGDPAGYTDGQEVAALLDFTLPRTVRWNYGPPFGPPAAWPNFNDRLGTHANVCNDGDYDTIPDYAEAYVVGTRVGTGDSENTDGDKFDDGQEFFGTTFCLPGQPDCGYGLYPRNQDFNFITNGMPSWIRPPGDSPFVAAYPVIDFLVDPATIEMTTKEIHTIERTITQGEEISSGFAETQGNSTTVGTVDTNTHSTWQENSTTEGGIEPASAAALSIPQATTAFQPLVTGQAALMDGDIESAIPEHLCLITGLSSVSVSTGTPESLAVICRNLAADLFPAPAEPFAYAITKIELTPTAQKETEQALIDWMPVWRSSLLPTGSPALPVLGRRLGAQWVWSFAGDTNYRSWLESIPTRPDEETLQPSLGDHPLALSQDRMRGFKLPWSPETGSVVVTQGEYCLGDPSCFSHQTSYAYDFARSDRKGFAVVAARSGKVIDKKESSNSGCGESKCAGDMNYITIQHDDGTTAHYWHLAKDSVPFEVGERVQQGEQIGWAGSTGWSTAIHLHMEVRQNGGTVPIGFDEVAEQEHSDGMPIKGHSYTSANILPRNTCLAPEVASGTPVNATLPGQGKPASFIEVIGRKLKSWWGQLTGATALAQATGLAASPPGCSGSSCTSQVGGSGNYNLNYSDSRSAGQCGGSFSADSGSDWGVGGGGSGLALNDTGGAIERLRVWSQTTTNGEGWSTSHSELRSETQYAEITRSRTNTLVSSEAWSTATTVDPTDAAALTFNYNLYNTGSDAAVSLTGIKINVLIGDLPVITWNAPDRSDILPGQAKGPFSNALDPIILTLDQLAAIDNGAPIRVVLADYGYDDNLYDANAWGRSVLFHVDDGPADGDETIDTYLITTSLVQGETYQDTLARYFDVTTFQGAPGDERNGTITGIRTPEFAGDGEITGWHDHPVNEHAWWELSISLGGETAGVQHFRDMPAKAKTDVYLRYVLDTDADGFSDRAELDAGSDPNDPDIHPRPLLTVAQHTAVNGSSASVQVTLQNDGNLDASSVELWAIAADDSITVNDNLVGGGGRVRAGRQVVLGARIGKPDLAAWQTSTAKPYPDGQFEGTSPKTFKFQALESGNVGSGTLRVRWSSDGGATWQATPLALGSGYTAWTPLPLSDGLSIAFSGGYIALNETFTFATALPIDTFAYTINRTPYTPPLIIASYNDPQGNHKFVSDVALADIQADLAPYLGQMRYGFQLDVLGETPLHAGANTAYIIFNNPADTAISGGNVFVEFATPDGVVAKEYVLAGQTFQPGPNVATLAWDTADFSPAFDPAQDYHILAFAADRQGTIFENTVKDLDQLGQDRLPAFAMADADATWDFGATQQGTLLTRSFTFANTGALDLLTYVSAPAGLTVSQTGSRTVGLADMTTYEMALNTASLGVGPYTGDITIRTSDPAQSTKTVHVTGAVTAAHCDGFYGEYFANKTLSGEPIFTRCDGILDFNWGTGSPDAAIPADNFSARWTKQFQVHAAEVYTFDVRSDDGVRVYVDDQLVVDYWSDHSFWFTTGSKSLAVGEHTLRVEYYENGGSAAIRLVYGLPGTRMHPLDWPATVSGTQGQWVEFTHTLGPEPQTLHPVKVYNKDHSVLHGMGKVGAPPDTLYRRIWATVLGVDANAHGDFGIYSPVNQVIFHDYHNYIGQSTSFRYVSTGQNEVYYIYGINSYGGPHLSTSDWARVIQENSNTWRIEWDDGLWDRDYNDLVVRVQRTEELERHYIIEQIESSPYNRARLNLPATGTSTYQIQYGRKLNWSGAANQVTTLRVPAGMSTSVTLQALVSDLPSNAAFALDIGNTGSDSWNGTVGNGGEYTSPNLATFFNAYWASHGAPTTGTLDVPVRVYLDRAGQVLLTNLQVTPTGSKTRAVRLPIRPQGYSSVTASFTVSGGTGPLAVGVDVGADGSVDWTYTGAPAYPATLTTGNLAAAVNAYLSSVVGQPSADVPLRFFLSPFATLTLTGFNATPVGGMDASIGAGDITFSAAAPTEGNEVTVSATIHNTGALDTGPLVVAFYATPPGQSETQIGSALVPAVAPGSQSPVSIPWHTLGFTGDVPVRAVVDPFNRLAEADEDNNAAAAALPIKTRPDLRVAAIALSDDEPVVGQAVTVTLTLHNDGQTAAGPAHLALYDDQPDGIRTVACEDDGGVPANATRTITCQWTPAAAGAHRLFAQADRDRAVNESNEGNNDAWRALYAGFAGPLLLDSGGGDAYDPGYAPEHGYGYVDEGAADVTTACGAGGAPDDTLRQDPDGRLVYRFDHFQPGHFYHLDIVLRECDGAGRQETISVDGNPIAGPVDLLDGAAHAFSILLDPAFYADRGITVAIEAPGIDGAVVSQVNVHDVDYRYADAGGANDPQYTAATGYGWLDGVKNTGYGSLPYRSVRVDQADNLLRYRFDGLPPDARYQLRFTFFQSAGGARIQEVEVDGIWTGLEVNSGDYQPHRETIDVPPGAYQDDGSIVVGIRRTNAATGAFVNEIALEALTLQGLTTQNLVLRATSPNWISTNIKPPVRPALYCAGVTATSSFTTLAGDALLAGGPAPVNSIVEAYTPAGVKVGCFKITTAGKYGYLRVYGAEGATPGMTAGAPIQLKLNGIAAVPTPYPVLWQNDKLIRDVDLAAPDVIPVEAFLDALGGQVVKLQSETGTYLPPPADPRFNTLTTVAPGQGYLLYTTAAATLPVVGARVPADAPLPLRAGWNWLGYLPTCELPVATALAGIAGQYDLLNGETGTYSPPPADPAHNTLTSLRPGQGYMIHMTAAATLVYPANTCGTALNATSPTAPTAFTCPVTATSRFTHFYGHATRETGPLPAGTVILAYSPRGEVAGCGQVKEDGLYPYLRVFGAEGDLPGLLAGEAVRFTVNGLPAQASTEALWQDDWAIHPLDLTLTGVQYQFLPMIVR